jgi:hypothetical protein
MAHIVVYHGNFNCDTGCCGHRVEIDRHQRGFTFDHPDQAVSDDDLRAWARQVVIDETGEHHASDLDWDNCVIIGYRARHGDGWCQWG